MRSSSRSSRKRPPQSRLKPDTGVWMRPKWRSGRMPRSDRWQNIPIALTTPESARHWADGRLLLPNPVTSGFPAIRPRTSVASYIYASVRLEDYLRVVFRLRDRFQVIKKKVTTSSNTSLPTFTARCTRSLGPPNPLRQQRFSTTEFLRHRGTQCSGGLRSGPRSPNERDRDGKVWPPPAPSVVVASDNFRDDAKPADLPSG